MRPARMRRDIADIDSIIEINGRQIVTTVETRRDLSRGNARNNVVVSIVVESKGYPGNERRDSRYRILREYPGSG